MTDWLEPYMVKASLSYAFYTSQYEYLARTGAFNTRHLSLLCISFITSIPNFHKRHNNATYQQHMTSLPGSDIPFSPGTAELDSSPPLEVEFDTCGR